MPCGLEDKELSCLRDFVCEVVSEMDYLVSINGRMVPESPERIWIEEVVA
jgi:hypothetical protein